MNDERFPGLHRRGVRAPRTRAARGGPGGGAGGGGGEAAAVAGRSRQAAPSASARREAVGIEDSPE